MYTVRASAYGRTQVYTFSCVQERAAWIVKNAYWLNTISWVAK